MKILFTIRKMIALNTMYTKRFVLILALFLAAFTARAQQSLLAYEDISYIISHNFQKADDFMQSKGYVPVNKKLKPGNKAYTLNLAGGTHSNVEIRQDGKRTYIYIDTDELAQYNILDSSVSAYVTSRESSGDIMMLQVKDMGSIYINVNETVPYSAIKKNYDIRIVSDKNITAYN